MTTEREAHLLDRVRETAKRCIDLGVRVDMPGWESHYSIECDAVNDYLTTCKNALFQLAEVAGWGEMYTKEDVEQARNDGYNDGYDSGRSEGYDVGYEDGVAASASE
jgi:hypothetical protein